MMEQKPLTIEGLKEMAGQPVWCPDEEAYGIVMCDKIGQWAGIGTVVLRNNQTEQRGHNHRIFPLVLHREM